MKNKNVFNWEDTVNKLKIKHFSLNTNVDLVEVFNNLKNITQNGTTPMEDAIKHQFDLISDSVIALQKIKKYEEKLLNQYEKISSPIIKNDYFAASKVSIDEEINRIKIKINNTSLLLNNSRSNGKRSKKYQGSKSQRLISILSFTFYEGTGRIPDCDMGKQYDDYHGSFYYFLLDAKPLLKMIGVDLESKSPIKDADKNATIGRYAYKSIHGHKRKNKKEKQGKDMPSFEEIIELIEEEL